MYLLTHKTLIVAYYIPGPTEINKTISEFEECTVK